MAKTSLHTHTAVARLPGVGFLVLHHFSQPVCIVISLNDIRMTTFTHQLLSRKTSTSEVWECDCEYSSRSSMVTVAVWRLGYAEVVFIQPGGKLDTIWRGAWQRLASSYPTSRWDVAVTNGHCSRTALPLTPPETQKLAAWEPSVQWAKHFVHRIARI